MGEIKVDQIDHVALAVRDVEKSAKWYEEVLGFRREHQDVWGSYPAFIMAGSTGIALFPVESESPEPPPNRKTIAMRHLAFRAGKEMFEQAKEELRKRNIAFEYQHHTVSHSIYFSDPDGHELEITSYEL